MRYYEEMGKGKNIPLSFVSRKHTSLFICFLPLSNEPSDMATQNVPHKTSGAELLAGFLTSERGLSDRNQPKSGMDDCYLQDGSNIEGVHLKLKDTQILPHSCTCGRTPRVPG